MMEIHEILARAVEAAGDEAAEAVIRVLRDWLDEASEWERLRPPATEYPRVGWFPPAAQRSVQIAILRDLAALVVLEVREGERRYRKELSAGDPRDTSARR